MWRRVLDLITRTRRPLVFFDFETAGLSGAPPVEFAALVWAPWCEPEMDALSVRARTDNGSISGSHHGAHTSAANSTGGAPERPLVSKSKNTSGRRVRVMRSRTRRHITAPGRSACRPAG